MWVLCAEMRKNSNEQQTNYNEQTCAHSCSLFSTTHSNPKAETPCNILYLLFITSNESESMCVGSCLAVLSLSLQVKSLLGSYELDVSPAESVESLKLAVGKLSGIPP